MTEQAGAQHLDASLSKHMLITKKLAVCSLLAGYAWDEKNPYVAQSDRRLQTLYELIKNDA